MNNRRTEMRKNLKISPAAGQEMSCIFSVHPKRSWQLVTAIMIMKCF